MQSSNIRSLFAFTAISVVSLAYLKYRQRILHIKGFASYVDFSSTHKEVLNSAFDFLIRYNPTEIVWDGDHIVDSSFTQIIMKFYQQVAIKKKRPVKFTCFVIDGVHNPTLIRQIIPNARIISKKCHPQNQFHLHGLEALKETRAKNVLVIGIGPCVSREIQEADPDVTFHIIDFPRNHPTQGIQSMISFFEKNPPVNVRLIQKFIYGNGNGSCSPTDTM